MFFCFCEAGWAHLFANLFSSIINAMSIYISRYMYVPNGTNIHLSIITDLDTMSYQADEQSCRTDFTRHLLMTQFKDGL